MDFAVLTLPANIAIFAAAAVVVWLAGVRLAKYADAISRRTGLGQALIGLLLLAVVTSLPEIATSVTAAGIGDGPLAVNNLLGSIAMQVALLAVADAVYGKSALTSVVPDPDVMLQGALNIGLLCLVAMATVVGDIALGGAGLWTWSVFAASIGAMYMLVQANERKPWIPNTDKDLGPPDKAVEHLETSNLALGLRTLGAALVILAAGFLVASTGNVIADQSGIGSSFMGFAFVAIATSLPEASTVFAALRRGLHTMAISDILGTNILNIGLIFIVDMIASGDAVLTSVGTFGAVAALIGIFVTTLFVIGLAERRDVTVFRMGVDSAAVLVAYFGGLALLYTLREAA